MPEPPASASPVPSPAAQGATAASRPAAGYPAAPAARRPAGYPAAPAARPQPASEPLAPAIRDLFAEPEITGVSAAGDAESYENSRDERPYGS
jgi:hypothetical protein